MPALTPHHLLATSSSSFIEIITTVNPRELAIISWMGIFLVGALASEKLRTPILNIFKAALNKKSVIVYLLITSYTLSCTYLLSTVDLFTANQTKSVIIWIFTVALRQIVRQKKFQEDLLKEILTLLKTSITYISIISFFINRIPFNFYFEFILGVPFIIFLGLFLAVNESTNNKIPLKLLNIIFSFLVIFILIRTLVYIHQDNESYSLQSMALDFILPTILTILYIPLLTILTLFFSYEILFIRINFIVKNKRLAKYAKILAPFVFNFNMKLAQRWVLLLQQEDLHLKDVNASIIKIYKLWASEKRNKHVSISDGWAPKKAKSFLQEFAIIVKDYNYTHKDKLYGSFSKELYTQEELCTLCYSIDGLKECVKKISLDFSSIRIIPTNNLTTPQKQEYNFLPIFQKLWSNAFNEAIPSQINYAISNHSSTKVQRGNSLGIVVSEIRPNGYDIKLIIIQKDWENP
ncbi:MAG: hypothetical protein ACNI3A_18030 [Desulfovibrio sp.]|uniref:hypothetical protein n=1 Tax=Desulfovibrio sp. 7SRBS1 TaxID=3378064 RepID=UPI003B4172C1